MNLQAIHHLPDLPYAYAEDAQTLRVRLRAARGDLRACTVLFKDRYDWQTPYARLPMRLLTHTALFDYFEARLCVSSARFRYVFALESQEGRVVYYNERGFCDTQPDEREAFQYAYISAADLFHPVEWAREQVVYSIFPDRFCNGDPANDPPGTVPWGTPVGQRTVCGGDLRGMLEKLPYLSELGVSLLYVTPLFQSASNHKYNIDDYLKIDPWFGDAALARQFVDACHERGIRVLFDAVFNHCGTGFFAFQDVLRNGERSQYKDWFFLHGFPVDTKTPNYENFGDVAADMPKLNTSNPEVRRYLLDVAAYWLNEVKIDGWRLDVCDEVSHDFWKAFRTFLKGINPQALIVGEVQHEASAFLRGDELDSSMNYPFREICVRFFAKRQLSAAAFESEIEENRMRYADPVARMMFNVLDSHDTERFLTMCDGKKERLRCALVFSFTYIGLPYLFYGDEVGVAGGYDPLCRQCMVWETEKQDTGLLALCRALIRIRRENPCLVNGDFTGFSGQNVLAYARDGGGSRVVVLINNTDEPHRVDTQALSGAYTDLLGGNPAVLSWETQLAPNTFFILKKH